MPRRQQKKVCATMNTSNKSYLYGDTDKDGTANMDDRYPYNPKKDEKVADFSLAKDFKDIDKHNAEHKKHVSSIKNHFESQGFPTKYRTKSTYSTVNKLKRKHLKDLWDIGGVTVIVKNHDEAYKVDNEIRKKYDVVDSDDYYKHPKGGYKALHYNLKMKDGKMIEVQVKTQAEYDKAQRTHAQYKSGD